MSGGKEEIYMNLPRLYVYLFGQMGENSGAHTHARTYTRTHTNLTLKALPNQLEENY